MRKQYFEPEILKISYQTDVILASGDGTVNDIYSIGWNGDDWMK